MSVHYDVNATKSYMRAMSFLQESMAQLGDLDTIPKIPTIDNDRSRITSIDKIVDGFKSVKIQDVGRILPVGSDSFSKNDAAAKEIVRECETLGDQVLDMIRQAIELSSEEEELQSQLFDILGFEKFDLISKILQHKDSLLQRNKESVIIDQDPNRLLTTEERVQLLVDNQNRTKNQRILPKLLSRQYPHVFKAPDSGTGMLSSIGKKYALPQGSTRQQYNTYEEIIIPAPERKANRWITKEQLIKVNSLDLFCQGTFKNYSTLNMMQSIVFPVAYETNENMLVCAPTGAGKTDVAMLTILRTISEFSNEIQHEEGMTLDIDYEEFKIVYVAPLKALAAEIVDKYSKKLAWLGITVKELTGDMQLSKQEIMTTQIIVTTPEKWDVVTRKLSGDNDLVAKVKLLIIDEVHLLHEDRGSVIETLVARTLRQVESSQLMIRVVGLSATLPNFMDVADFLGVNRQVGMFYFDATFRPVPLQQNLIGVNKNQPENEERKPPMVVIQQNLDSVCYNKLVEYLREGKQVMIFVHSRKETVKTAKTFIRMAREKGETRLFSCENSSKYSFYSKEMGHKNRNKDMRELFPSGFGIHNAGMLRSDRNLTERMFMDGALKVLCTTATLAWGVNLPAAVVIVKGTQVYDSKKGGLVDLGISDVIQIFGRAGRPQFEEFGTGILLTTIDKLDHYVSLITQQHPIESKLAEKLIDNLNAEISLGTVTNIEEGVQWLGYSYMFVRMRQNPFGYGIEWAELKEDPLLYNRRRTLILTSARRLHHLQMIIFDENSGSFTSKNLGRIASDFYLLNNSVEIFNQMMNPRATEADVLAMISMSSEFDGIVFRKDEEGALRKLYETNSACQVPGDVESPQGKANILLQAFISRASIGEPALIADSNYVAQNAARICRALFNIGITRKWGIFLKVMLSLCKAIDKRIWEFDHPMTQFDLPDTVLKNIRDKNPSMDMLREMSPGELGDYVHNSKMGHSLYKLIGKFPYVDIETEIFPIATNVMRVHVNLYPDFVWDEKYHGTVQMFWITVEESNASEILHVEKLILNKRSMKGNHELDFMIPLSDPLPPQVVVRVISDSWIGSESVHAISFQHLIRPQNETIRTKLLRLQPLPVTALHNPDIELIYSTKFKYFNPMQTMVFHSLYNTNSSVFVGSPTGSGKTVVAELAIWHAFNEFPGSKVVYIAPMKALVRERVDDWRARICCQTLYKLVELTGDSLPEPHEVREADIIITTPEKFDGISRNWQTRKFVQGISLVIMDEIHLLASDRGPILEMIVSRMNYISSQTRKPIRLLGMSTAVSNAFDMAGWLGVKEGLFNFPQSVRPVPLQMYIDGFPDNIGFSPLMKSMNKPAFMAIKQHSPHKPVLIFVASRRQTRLTALDLIHMCGMESNPRRFLNMGEDELQSIMDNVKDETLRLALQFGMGLHHAGLVESDRQISHKLFEAGKIQILIATSTLAWGVNLPAHLVIIKGTQFFDSKIEGYRDMDLTDILQMMGRAGRPAFDTSGIAIVYTKESKKAFYKHFLNIGFPVESSLHKVLDDHIGAEISSGTIKTRQEAMDFLTWTFLYRRAHNNPTYYGIEDQSTMGVAKYLGGLIDETIEHLRESKCVLVNGKDELISTPFLDITSYYYLSHKTIRNFVQKIKKDFGFRECLQLLCQATEYDELATRHGEELINMELSQVSRFPAQDLDYEYIWDPHIKAYLLVQAFISRIEFPIADYSQDTIAVLDQSLRILQAFIDAAAELGYFKTVMLFIKLMQCIKQRYWYDDDPVTALPGLMVKAMNEKASETSLENLGNFNRTRLANLSETLGVTYNTQDKMAIEKPYIHNTEDMKNEFITIASKLPVGTFSVEKTSDGNNIQCTLVHKNPPLNKDFKVYCPHFPKPQRESWFLIVSDLQDDELLVLKRASPKMIGKRGKIESLVTIPPELKGQEVKVHLINDAMDLRYCENVSL
ncbi:uncharacterized protein KQ657_000940 [Scheffersomyces spartinae]|uniref:RNA helicase n=1 Tax=Scheffersomyces spartinae TaxID=45513 RepID=A0A9P8AHV3_9ASCO|nr:uncharacterized protein KQ657_000940 [Scheffersomyces spartinae]KAG7193183.1 hypothetical protein KQ657_000940 [Scheffersomyces spartinae]